ncbi:hypothetical protein M378DRAFT_78430 [Amanita muscaria Koide BX008]|uniref:RRM domain-containing protein n=1 Tax=Amanita muscaria (strain Koide BX008) TaxID=946122 RepID=A0A0C2WRR8_AMAMK|nr:hypothetical protein M378DRAFT_78430 [Amanita muscaria Koide BX008]
MSRLIVKNLPFGVTPAHLKDHFEQKNGPGGTITDVKVAYKRDGTSRRFGFVGYKTEQEAEAAKKWFDRTFIDSSRIDVTTVEGVKDAPLPRPNKRRRVDPSPDEAETLKDAPKKSDTDKKASKSKDGKQDQLDEFMQVMKPRTTKGPSWANEESFTSAAGAQSSSAKPNAEPVTEDKQEGDGPQEGISDLDWLKKHMSNNVDTIDKVFEQSDDEMDAATKTEVRCCSFLHRFCPYRLLGKEARRITKRFNKGNHTADVSLVSAEPGLYVHRL